MTLSYDPQLAVLPGDQMLVTAGDRIDLWDADTGEYVRSVVAATNADLKEPSMALSPDGRFLALGGTKRSVDVWDVETGEAVHQFSVPRSPGALSFSPDGALLAISAPFGGTSVRDLSNGLECFSQKSPTQFAGFTPDGRHLAVVARHRVSLWTSGQ